MLHVWLDWWCRGTLQQSSAAAEAQVKAAAAALTARAAVELAAVELAAAEQAAAEAKRVTTVRVIEIEPPSTGALTPSQASISTFLA